jgi:hypothetical protein
MTLTLFGTKLRVFSASTSRYSHSTSSNTRWALRPLSDS